MTERWFPDSMPQPMVDPITLPWWKAAAEHRLTVQRCNGCGHCTLPPAPICSACRKNDLSLVEVSGAGEIYTWTTVHRPVAMEQELPFVIAIIELDVSAIPGANGVRIMSNLVNVDPESIALGMKVRVAWETMSDEVSVPRFTPVS